MAQSPKVPPPLFSQSHRRVAAALIVSVSLLALEGVVRRQVGGGDNSISHGDPANGLTDGRRLQSHYGTNSHTQQHSAKDSIIHAIAGFICIIMSINILFVNEGRYVKMGALLSSARSKVKIVSGKQAEDNNQSNEPGSTSVDKTNDGQLVHVVGTLEMTRGSIKDTAKGSPFPEVTAPTTACKLKRTVEMFQWSEDKKDEGGQTSYTYTTQWCSSQNNSDNFNDTSKRNPKMPCRGGMNYAEGMMLNGYQVMPRVLGKLSTWKDMPIGQQMSKMRIAGWQEPREDQGYVRFNYVGDVQVGDVVGDVRVKYEYVDAQLISITAQQAGDRFQPLHSNSDSACPGLSECMPGGGQGNFAPVSQEEDSDGLTGASDFEDAPGIMDDLGRGVGAVVKADFAQLCKQWTCCCVGCGLGLSFMEGAAPVEVFAVREGDHTPEENLKVVEGESGMMLHALRLFGFLLMWGGLKMMFDPLMALFRFIPFVGGAFAALLGFLTFFCACFASIFIIAIAWVMYRPLIGILILGVTIGIWVAFSCHEGTCPGQSVPQPALRGQAATDPTPAYAGVTDSPQAAPPVVTAAPPAVAYNAPLTTMPPAVAYNAPLTTMPPAGLQG